MLPDEEFSRLQKLLETKKRLGELSENDHHRVLVAFVRVFFCGHGPAPLGFGLGMHLTTFNEAVVEMKRILLDLHPEWAEELSKLPSMHVSRGRS